MELSSDQCRALSFIQKLCPDSNQCSGGTDEIHFDFIAFVLAWHVSGFSLIHLIQNKCCKSIFDFESDLFNWLQKLFGFWIFSEYNFRGSDWKLVALSSDFFKKQTDMPK
jgi:hypothetical protein